MSNYTHARNFLRNLDEEITQKSTLLRYIQWKNKFKANYFLEKKKGINFAMKLPFHHKQMQRKSKCTATPCDRNKIPSHRNSLPRIGNFVIFLELIWNILTNFPILKSQVNMHM